MKLLGLLTLLAVLASCGITQPDLTRIYAKQEGEVAQPPVIVIHGALGSRLYDPVTQKEVWPGSIWKIIFSSYPDLELDINADTMMPTATKLVPNGVTSRVGGVDFYGRILDVLEDAGGYEYAEPGSPQPADGKRYYVFSYDWRQDMLVAVRQLDAFIEQVRADYSDPELEVDVVAHSMGGLITRYFARYGTVDVLNDNDFPVNLDGARKIRRVVLLGTPNLGSATALRTLVRGYKIILGTIPVETVVTFPSTYQLLPHAINEWLVDVNGEPLDLGDLDQFTTEFWRSFQFSIFQPEVEARIRARYSDPADADDYIATLHDYFERHIERARRFSWSLTVPVDGASIDYIVFGSDCFDTPARTVVEERNGKNELRLFPREVKNRRPDIDYDALMLEPGDGVVTTASLMARQTFDPTVSRHQYSYFPLDYPIFLCEEHGHLTGNVHFQNNLLYALLSVDR